MLNWGPGTAAGDARARRIASKCDHCMPISPIRRACRPGPTGCIDRSLGLRPVSRTSDQLTRAVARGAERVRSQTLLLAIALRFSPIEAVHSGDWRSSNAGLAKTRRGQASCPVAFCGGWHSRPSGCSLWPRYLLRLHRPKRTRCSYVLLRNDGYSPQEAIQAVRYNIGSDFSIWLGIIGTALMAISAVYPFWRRLRIFRYVASNAMWFDFHMMAGIVGPMFIVLHSALKLDNWKSPALPAFWSMVIVVLSGVIGRYLYTQVPDMLNGRELEELDHQRALSRMRKQHPALARAANDAMSSARASVTSLGGSAGLTRVLIWMIWEDLKRPGRWFPP